jgi:hypothetical protein
MDDELFNLRVPDQRLRDAILLPILDLSQQREDLRHSAEEYIRASSKVLYLTTEKVHVRFVDDLDKSYAQYLVRDRVIEVSRRYADCPSNQLHALLVHEEIHARPRLRDPDYKITAEEELEEELLAHTREAQIWHALRRGEDTGDLADMLNANLRRWRDDELTAFVRKHYAASFGLPEEIIAPLQEKEPPPTSWQIPKKPLPQAEKLPLQHQPEQQHALPEEVVRNERARLSALSIGKRYWTKESVTLKNDQRLRHTLIVGKSGTGKSNLILHSMLQDARNHLGFCLFDPFGLLAERFLSLVPTQRIKDVVYLDIGDADYAFGLNIFDTTGLTSAQIDGRVSQTAELFQKVWAGAEGVTMERWAKTIARTYMDAGKGTLADAWRLLSDPDYRAPFLDTLTDEFEHYIWRENTNAKTGKPDNTSITSTINRLALFNQSRIIKHIVGQQRTKVDFPKLMRERKIIICNLKPPMKDPRATVIIGTLLMQRILSAAMEESREHPYFLYADEFHLFATDDFLDIINGLRNFGLGLIAATQQLVNIDEEKVRKGAMGANNMVLFDLTPDDAATFSRHFHKLEDEIQLRSLPYASGLFAHYVPPAHWDYDRIGNENIKTIRNVVWTTPPLEEHESVATELTNRYLEYGLLWGVYKYPQFEPVWRRIDKYLENCMSGTLPDGFEAIFSDPTMNEDDRLFVEARRDRIKGLGDWLAKNPARYREPGTKSPTLREVLSSLSVDFALGTAACTLLSVGEVLVQTPKVDAPVTSIADTIRNASREQYYRRREEVEEEIRNRLQPSTMKNDPLQDKPVEQPSLIQRRVPRPPSS